MSDSLTLTLTLDNREVFGAGFAIQDAATGLARSDVVVDFAISGEASFDPDEIVQEQQTISTENGLVLIAWPFIFGLIFHIYSQAFTR